MAEQKRRGFHALEKRIHELEDEERAPERKAPKDEEGTRREAAEKLQEKK